MLTRLLSARRTSPQRFRPQVTEVEDRLTPALGVALSNNTLILADTAAPASPTATLPVSGLNAGDNLVDVDFRPQNGLLYGLGYNATAGTVQLYRLSATTGAAIALGATGTFVDAGGNSVRIGVDASTVIGIDFNPTADRLRVVTSSGQNFRMNANTGGFVDGDAATPGLNQDGAINGGTTTVQGTAYTNNAQNARVTTQYTIDPTTGNLFIQNPPNAGTQTVPVPITLNGSPLTFTAVGGFDIPPGVTVTTANSQATGSGVAVLTVGGVPGLYSIDLTTGAATLLAASPVPVQGIAIQTNTTLVRAFGPERGAPGVVQVYNVDNTPRFTLTPFGNDFTGGISVAVADVNGDGVSDIITAPASGGGPNVIVYSGVDGSQIVSFLGAPVGFVGSITVAAGDIDGDGDVEIVTGLGLGSGPVVAVFDGDTGAFVNAFFAYDQGFRGGVSVAVRDVNADGVAEIVTGAGIGGGPVVNVFTPTGALLNAFFAYGEDFRGGVEVAAGRDGTDAAIVTAPGNTGGGPAVNVFTPTGTLKRAFFAYDPNLRNGANVGYSEDGLILTGPGVGNGPIVNEYEITNAALLATFAVGDPNGRTGIFVA